MSENRRPPNILWCCAGELYDLQEDPHEHANLWDSPEPEHQARKLELMKRSFDATVHHAFVATPPGHDPGGRGAGDRLP